MEKKIFNEPLGDLSKATKAELRNFIKWAEDEIAEWKAFLKMVKKVLKEKK